MKVALCAFAKLENLYLQEWIAYHLKLGFDKIYIYDNNAPKTERCEDGFVQDNRVVVFKHYMGKTDGGCKLQVEAYNEFYTRFGKDFDWVLFLDIDEFLTLVAHNDVHDYLEDVTRKNISATEITLFWKCYTDSGMLRYEPRPVRERFAELSENEEVNKYHKQFYKTKVKNLILRNIHYATPQTAIDNKGDWMPHLCNVTSEKPNHDLAYISHYATKTVEEYVCIKKKRRVDGNSKKRLNMEHFFKFNKRTDEKANYFRELENEGDVEHVFGKVENVVKNNEKIIVSFTSWTKRIQYCRHTVDLMLSQTLKPDKIILNLSTDEFPNKEQDLPIDLINAQNNVFEIYWLKENTKVYKKIRPTLERFPNDLILSIDDDIEYPKNYIEKMYNTFLMYGGNYPIVGYKNEEKPNVYRHSGPFSLVKREFYGDYLKDLYDNVVVKNGINIITSDDEILFYTSLLNGTTYKLCEDILSLSSELYKKSVIDCNYSNNRYSLYDLNWKKMYKKQKDITLNYIFNKYGLTYDDLIENAKRNQNGGKIIVSFTTWKKRHNAAARMLEHFKQQTLKPDKIVCWLSSDEYEGENTPECLQKFVDENYIEVKWVKENTFCHKRYEIFKEHQNDYVFLIDDDIYYEPTYIEEMYICAVEHRKNIINYLGNIIEYDSNCKLLPLKKHSSLKNTLLSGLSCYPPNVFPYEYFENKFAIKTISPKCDDSILRALMIKNSIEVYCIHNRSEKEFKSIPNTQSVGIWEENKIKINGVSKKTRTFKTLLSFFGLEVKAREIWPNIVFENYGIKEKIIQRAKEKHFENFNLDNPQTWCEKMQWMQIYDTKNDLKTFCADKIKVHEYSKQKLGKDICVPLLKVYDTPNDIVVDELPDKFILKCNHGYANNIIVKNKNEFNLEVAKEKLTQWLSEPFGVKSLEPHYVGIDRKCYAEMLLEEPEKEDVTDYKFICFNGKPTYVQIISDRHNVNKRLNYYDMDFKFVDICRNDFPNNPNMLDEKPSQFELMKEYAKKLSEDFRFVRVDFYEVNNVVYLGEMTFTPATGFIKWTDPNIDKKFGDMLEL